jgi:hypothetical protein
MCDTDRSPGCYQPGAQASGRQAPRAGKRRGLSDPSLVIRAGRGSDQRRIFARGHTDWLRLTVVGGINRWARWPIVRRARRSTDNHLLHLPLDDALARFRSRRRLSRAGRGGTLRLPVKYTRQAFRRQAAVSTGPVADDRVSSPRPIGRRGSGCPGPVHSGGAPEFCRAGCASGGGRL